MCLPLFNAPVETVRLPVALEVSAAPTCFHPLNPFSHPPTHPPALSCRSGDVEAARGALFAVALHLSTDDHLFTSYPSTLSCHSPLPWARRRWLSNRLQWSQWRRLSCLQRRQQRQLSSLLPSQWQPCPSGLLMQRWGQKQ